MQGGLYRLVVIAGAVDGQSHIERNLSALDANDQPLLTFLQQGQHPLDVVRSHADLGGDFLGRMSLGAKGGDAGQILQRFLLAAGNVLDEAHQEGILVADLDHDGRDFLFAKVAEGRQPALAKYQHIPLLACVRGARCYLDRFLEADILDVADDDFECLGVAVAWIEHVDLVDRDHADFFAGLFGAHAALRIRVRPAMP